MFRALAFRVPALPCQNAVCVPGILGVGVLGFPRSPARTQGVCRLDCVPPALLAATAGWG